MSRTYKDAPYKVRAWRLRHTWQATAWHSFTCETSAIRNFGVYKHRESHSCNLDDFDPRLRITRGRHSEQCEWVLQHHFYMGVPNDFVSRDYHRPQRRYARDAGRAALKEWNGSGDTDVDIINRQARNSSRWNWW